MSRLRALAILLVLPASAVSASDETLPALLTIIRTGHYAPPAPANSGAIRVLDWNIDRGAHLDEIAAGLQVPGAPRICLLQEVDLNAARSGRVDVADALARKLRLNFAFGAAFQELGQGTTQSPAWQGQAILSAFPIISSRILRFQRQTAFWAPRSWVPARVPLMQRRVGGRIALVSEIDVGGRTLVAYNLHLESRGLGYTRYAQLKETLNDARRYGPETPILMGGDLNTKYAASRFTGLLRQAGFHDCFADSGGRTHRIVGRLDWIFVRGPLTCESSAVERSAAGSDHFLLSALLRKTEP